MNDQIAWLRTQIDADQAEIERHPDGEDDPDRDIEATAERNYPCTPYLRINKRRALDEVEAKRRMLDELTKWADDDFAPLNDNIVGLLTLPYVGREGCQEKWKP